MANGSSARHRIVILDSRYSGAAGSVAGMENHAAIAEGVTILTASRSDQPSLERKGHGVFTSLLINALEGAAANLTGSITPGSVYAHIDQSLGMWDQRPVFKTNTDSFVSLREVDPAISLDDLRKLKKLFPTEDYEYRLDPSYEPRDEGRTDAMLQQSPGTTGCSWAPEIQPAWSSGSSWRRSYVERGDGEQVLPVDAPRQALSKACGPGPALTR